jgi:hypothetical protein
MPVTRHRSVEEIPEPRRAASALQGLAAACAASTLSEAFGHSRRAPRGVRRFRSVEEADAHRQRWEAPPDGAAEATDTAASVTSEERQDRTGS